MASDGAEVAEDYRHALEDLSSNMRFEISNLTVIARENTEHALAIAEVLQQHILKAPPNKKLPALYVLDSIVKNVGTPYTLYVGRNLFKIFMESYAVVDQPIRRKMEEMLKTWKDPVPGSMDTRSVFSHELVRPIENALMKARALSMPQQAPIPGRPRAVVHSHRNTPTPPGMHGFPGPGGFTPKQYPFANGGHPGEPVQTHAPYPGQQQIPYYPPQSTPQSFNSTPAPFQPPMSGPYGLVGAAAAPAGISVETLNNDIHNLIAAMKAEFAKNPHDASIQNRLRALMDLQGVVQRTSLPPDQLELIKNKVTELAVVTLRAAVAQNSTPIQAIVPTPPPQVLPAHLPSASVTPSPISAAPPTASVTLDSLLGKGALAALLSRQQATTSQNTTPNPPYGSVAIRPPPVVQPEAPKPAAPPATSLLDQLRAAGMLPTSTPVNAGGAAGPAPPPPMRLPLDLSSLLSAHRAEAGALGAGAVNGTVLDVVSIKQQFRPDTISSLYDALGAPCTQCGRRFKTDAEGRKKKTAHMDWHFRVHQRSTEAEKRGTHRSWYLDQQEWVKTRETVDSDHIVTAEETSAQTTKDSDAPKYIPVPEPSSGINNVCPICQEKFENKWLDTVQEWVWLDTVLVGNRAYHASCHSEATRDREETPGLSRRTPEPVLGKRKADVGLSSPKIRLQKTFG